jgi:enoyl-CoA hydratase/carnithine racemase
MTVAQILDPSPIAVSPTSDAVLYHRKGAVAHVTLNRPDVLNAMDLELFRGIKAGMERAGNDPLVRVVNLRGAGRGWCAGGDLRAVLAMLEREDVGELRNYIREGNTAFDSVRALAKPVIAVVQGACVGGGNELNSVCDLTIAADIARFGQAGPRIGSVPIMLHQTLSLQIGDKRAREVTMLCHLYSAQECLEMGWINKVVPLDQLDRAADEWSMELVNKSPTSLAIAKRMHNFTYEQGKAGLGILEELLTSFWRMEEPREGMRAFLEKRKPNWAVAGGS